MCTSRGFFMIQKQHDVKHYHSFEPAYWCYYYSNKSDCSMSLNMLFCSIAWTFYRKIEGKIARSTANTAIVVYQQRRRHRRANGFRRWWRTIAGRQVVLLLPAFCTPVQMAGGEAAQFFTASHQAYVRLTYTACEACNVSVLIFLGNCSYQAFQWPLSDFQVRHSRCVFNNTGQQRFWPMKKNVCF